MTQKERILAMLRSGPQTSLDFYEAYMPRFPARILELKADGYDITDERWAKKYKRWTLLEGQGRLF